ncbi:uncharacterized protein LOC143486740 isoform X3 [Brachyhypopomus gauderio]|uniref:uncharacterized protein LOC143486740 isoform X3 n=1 Tax=Brachyhypopomus gauderio TaxID=698409 RepID=UPI0040417EE0
MAESGEPAIYKWTDEDTRDLIRWRVANAALFTGKRNAAVRGFEAFVLEKKLPKAISPLYVKKSGRTLSKNIRLWWVSVISLWNIWVYDVAVSNAEVVEHSAACHNLGCEDRAHLKGFKENGSPAGLQHSKCSFNYVPGPRESAVETSLYRVLHRLSIRGQELDWCADARITPITKDAPSSSRSWDGERSGDHTIGCCVCQPVKEHQQLDVPAPPMISLLPQCITE